MSLTRIPGNQVPVLEKSGLMSREWYRFLYNLFELAGGGSSTVTPAELQAEIDALEVQVAGVTTDVNTLETSVDSLDTAVALLNTQVAAVEDEATYAYLAPAPIVTGDLGIGSFYDTTTQTAVAINTAYAITFNTVSVEKSVYRGSTTSRIYVTGPGWYNFQFSAQVDNTSGGNHLVYFWPRIDGVDVPNSASQVRLKGTDGELIASWNFFLEMAASSYFELMYSVSDTAVQIVAQAAASPVPGIPSVILTVNQVYSPLGH